MSKHIEEIFNDCFERMLSGESYDNCLRRYPEHANELSVMLSAVFDVKRRAYPIQPRPEFKYWSRVRMQGLQDYVARRPAASSPSAFHWKRSWAVALSAIMVIVLASGSTAAASSNAMPDQPLYGVKMAVEQAQVTLTFSDEGKAELYAQMAEKRAEEISLMASLGKADQVIATTQKMNDQLEQANINMLKLELKDAETTAGHAMPVINALPSAPVNPGIVPPVKSSQGIAPSTTSGTERTADDNMTVKSAAGANRITLSPQAAHARDKVSSSNTKSIATLEKAFEKAPDSVKQNIAELIKKTRQANERIQPKNYSPTDNKPASPYQKPGNSMNKSNQNGSKTDKDKDEVTTDKLPKTYISNPTDQQVTNNTQKTNGFTASTSNKTGSATMDTTIENSSPVIQHISPVTVPQLPKIINTTNGAATKYQPESNESVR